MSVDPGVERVLRGYAEMTFDDALAPIAQMRELARASGSTLPAEQVGSIVDHLVPEHGRSGLRIREYRPIRRVAWPGPAVLYFHSGGFVLNDVDVADPTSRALANRTGATVFAVEYRKAPEAPFPAAPEDAYAALEWVWARADDLEIDRERIVVAGDSSGGNLAAVVALMARDRSGPSVALQVLVYPVTDVDLDTDTWRSYGDGEFGISRETMAWFLRLYAKGVRVQPYLAPVRSQSLRGLPPALVILAEYDPLRDWGEAYVKRLRAAGVPVERHLYERQVHGFWWWSAATADAIDVFTRIGEFINR